MHTHQHLNTWQWLSDHRTSDYGHNHYFYLFLLAFSFCRQPSCATHTLQLTSDLCLSCNTLYYTTTKANLVDIIMYIKHQAERSSSLIFLFLSLIFATPPLHSSITYPLLHNPLMIKSERTCYITQRLRLPIVSGQLKPSMPHGNIHKTIAQRARVISIQVFSCQYLLPSSLYSSCPGSVSAGST